MSLQDHINWISFMGILVGITFSYYAWRTDDPASKARCATAAGCGFAVYLFFQIVAGEPGPPIYYP